MKFPVNSLLAGNSASETSRSRLPPPAESHTNFGCEISRNSSSRPISSETDSGRFVGGPTASGSTAPAPARSSDKLVKLTVDFGDQRRSVLAGLRQERADPKAELEGRQGLFVVNLAPRLPGRFVERLAEIFARARPPCLKCTDN